MSKHIHTHDRRSFLGKLGLGCAHVGATTLLSGINNMNLAGALASINRSWTTDTMDDYKALVCVYLGGGNDSFNMLVPSDTDRYNQYAATRLDLAIPQSDLLPINALGTPSGETYGLNPRMPELQSLFNSGKAAFVANCGVLFEPMTLENYNRAINRPTGLFSHSHQTLRWQTSLALNDPQSVGWAGRLADIIATNNTNQALSMNVSLSGTNTFQTGNQTQTYTIKPTGNGSELINGITSNSIYENLKRETLDNLLDVQQQNIFRKAYQETVIGSKNSSLQFDAAVAGVQLNTAFPNNSFGNNLRMTARTIGARDSLQFRNQTFFLGYGGWDTHGGTNNGLLGGLDAGVGAFQAAMEELGVSENVTLFIMSDFGRKLVPNNSGTDHAWGGNVFAVGGAVNGQRIYGDYPELALNSEFDAGGGRLIPTTSTDQYYAELALWFGASPSDLPYVLPNINNFWTPTSGSRPIGFMS